MNAIISHNLWRRLEGSRILRNVANSIEGAKLRQMEENPHDENFAKGMNDSKDDS